MRIIVALLVFLFWMEGANKGQTISNFIPAPKTLVYKTKGNYNNLIPVMLSDDKKEILSYPDPKDVKNGTSYLLPLQLHKHYLLDRKGIGSNVAFLKYTYAAYARLEHAPPLKVMFANILDKDPLLELCACGNKNGRPVDAKALNNQIDSMRLHVFCKVLKKADSK